MSRLAKFVLVALALCALVALIARFTREPEVARAVRNDATAEEPAREPTSDAVVLAQSSANERVEAAPPTTPIPELLPTTVLGRVVDPDGQPIAGARVRLGTSEELERVRSDPESRLQLGGSESTSPTDAAGEFAFADLPAENDVLLVGPERDGYSAELPWTFARPGREHVLVMFPVARANLTVDAVHVRTQEPLTNFIATVESLDAARSAGTRVKLIGARGTARAEIRFPPGGELEIALALPSMAIGRNPSTVRVVVPSANEELRVRFELDPDAEPVASEFGIVTGVVVDRATGAPLIGASVTTARRAGPRAASSQPSAEKGFTISTTREGRFRVAAPAAELHLFVRADGYRVDSRDALAGDELRFELDRGAELRVRVVRRDGKPAAPRWVYLLRVDASRPANFGIQARTDADGGWKSTGLEPGTWKVRLAPFGLDDSKALVADSARGTVSNASTTGADDEAIRPLELTLAAPAEVVFEVDE